MAGEITLTVIGNLTSDPELQYTNAGRAYARFSIATTSRNWDRTKGEFVEGDTVFMRCVTWSDLAEHVGKSLTKGTRVIADGVLRQNSYTNREGINVTTLEMTVNEIGPSLRYATAEVSRAPRTDNGGIGISSAPAAAAVPQPVAEPVSNNWDASADAATQDNSGAEELPF